MDAWFVCSLTALGSEILYLCQKLPKHTVLGNTKSFVCFRLNTDVKNIKVYFYLRQTKLESCVLVSPCWFLSQSDSKPCGANYFHNSLLIPKQL